MIVVNIADMKLSANGSDQIITYALGSCAGVTIFDPIARVGGMIHIMLPDSSISKRGEPINPCKFVDTGIPLLFKTAYSMGAKKSAIKVKIAGCSAIMDEDGIFNIGKRNYAALRKIFWKNNVLIESEHCGYNDSVTMSLDLASGEVFLKIQGKVEKL